MDRLKRSLSLGSESAGCSSSALNKPEVEFFSTPNAPLMQSKHRSFGDFELLENGCSRETILEEHLNPEPKERRDLKKASVKRGKVNGKNHFQFIQEEANKKVVLSAVQGKECFYISQYETFPQVSCDTPETYIAVLRRDSRTNAFKLFSRECECCDRVLGAFSCGAMSLLNGDRQQLLELSHGASPVNCGYDNTIDCNTVTVRIPAVHQDMSRDCWCARFGKNNGGLVGRSMPRVEEEQEEKSEEAQHKQIPVVRKTASSPCMPSCPTKQGGEKSFVESAFVINTRKPRYDRNSGSLRQKFLNNRVREASSKNLVWTMSKGKAESGDPALEGEDIVMQFGKLSENVFSCDFLFPLAPLQAFAIGLTLFDWQGDKNKDKLAKKR